MAKPEWGAKRICLNCGARFYDLNNSPIVCPNCGTPYDVEVASRARKARPSRAAAVDDEDVVAAKGAAATNDEDTEALDEVSDDEALVEGEDDAEDVPADTDEDEEDDALIEDVEELGDEDDMSDVIEGGRDEDEESR